MHSITDDNGVAMTPQYRVIDQRSNWCLVVDIHVVGDKAVHEFRIQHAQRDVEVLPGITLAEAQARFARYLG